MRLNNFIESINNTIKWCFAHLIKKAIMVSFCIFIVPLIILTVGFEALGNFFSSLHSMLENFFNLLYDLSDPFVITLFKSFGFYCAEIYLGDSYNHSGIETLKQVAKNNGIKCYIFQQMFRVDNSFYVKVIVSRQTDLNLLKLIFNNSKDKPTTTF